MDAVRRELQPVEIILVDSPFAKPLALADNGGDLGVSARGLFSVCVDGLASRIEDSRTKAAAAWIQQPLNALPHPSGRVWAGVDSMQPEWGVGTSNHLYLIALEGGNVGGV